jgi:hypothetical protein
MNQTGNEQAGVGRVIPISNATIRISGSFRDLAASIMTGNGDTVSIAIRENRCISQPIGCGQSLLKEDGSPRFNHFPDPETMALYAIEWRGTGLCPTCQDAMERRAAQVECCGNCPCTCQEPPYEMAL